jgi:hypothetical protein
VKNLMRGHVRGHMGGHTREPAVNVATETAGVGRGREVGREAGVGEERIAEIDRCGLARVRVGLEVLLRTRGSRRLVAGNGNSRDPAQGNDPDRAVRRRRKRRRARRKARRNIRKSRLRIRKRRRKTGR